MERKIGEVFTYNGITVITKEDEAGEFDCYPECVFANVCLTLKKSELIGFCSAENRSDGKSICFHRAGQEAQGFKITSKVNVGNVKVVTYCEKKFLVNSYINYMATDVNGDIFGYSTKPTLIGDTWRKTSSSCKCEFIANINFIGSCSESLRDVTE